MGFPLRRTQSPSRRANSTNTHSNPNNTSPNNSRSNNNSSSSSRKISKSRKSRSRPTSPNYYLDNPYRPSRQPAVIMVPNSLLPVTAYFPRDYEFEFEDEGYDSASSSTSESSVSPAPALGWRPTQGTLEMEFMFGDMDDEFMQELTRESTPSSDADEDMMDTSSSSSSTPSPSGPDEEEQAPVSDYDQSEASEVEEGGYDRQDRMGGRVVDEDYD